jgi:hypothetical protein
MSQLRAANLDLIGCCTARLLPMSTSFSGCYCHAAIIVVVPLLIFVVWSQLDQFSVQRLILLMCHLVIAHLLSMGVCLSLMRHLLHCY